MENGNVLNFWKMKNWKIKNWFFWNVGKWKMKNGKLKTCWNVGKWKIEKKENEKMDLGKMKNWNTTLMCIFLSTTWRLQLQRSSSLHSSDMPSFSIFKHTSQIARRASSSLPSALILNMFCLGGNRCRIAMKFFRL